MLHLYQLVGEFLLLFILTSIGVVSVPGYGHSNRCVSQCFNLHFPDNVCDKLGRTDILIMLSLPTHEHFSIYSPLQAR